MNSKIVINGIEADLQGASKQELVLTNPMWDYTAMQGSFGLPFKLPFSNTNNRIFGNANSEFATNTTQLFECTQYLNDDIIADGLIQLLDTNGSYNCNFISNIRDIFTPVGAGTVRYDGFLRDILPAGPSVATIAARNAMGTWNNIVCYPKILNTEFYSANAPSGWAGYVNDYDGSSYINTTFVPFVGVKYILSQLESYYGITFVGDAITEPYTLNKAVVGTNTAEDGSTTANLKIAVGEVKVAEFVNILRTQFGLTGEIDMLAKTIRLDFAKKAFDSEVASNWSPFCSKINAKTASPYNGIEISYQLDSEDKYLKTLPALNKYLTSGANVKPRKIEIPWCPIPGTPDGVWSIMSQPGRTTVNNQFNNRASLRFAYYLGVYDRDGGVMPNLNPGWDYFIFTPNQVRTEGPYRLDSEETFWKNTFEAAFQINATKLNISTLDLKQKVHIHGWNYLIKRIVIDTKEPHKSLLEAYRA